MAVRLVDGKTFNVPSDTRILSRKKQLIQSTVSLSSLPCSYRSNTPREEALLDYSEHFRRQFVQLYPSHSPLLLAPQNECGQRKFLCTSVKPLLLPFVDLYDLPSCASFVSDFLSYLPLDDPNQLPDYLPSLTSIIATRAGDCLDLSIFLCSLLRGSGHRALVVQGKAERWICEGDQSQVRCPLLRDEALEKKKREEEEAKRVAEERANNPYLAIVPQRPSHISQFQQNKANSAPQPPQPLSPPSPTPPSPAAHAWVLVLPGRRDVTHPLFIEPSTGAMWEVEKGGPYKEIVSAFDDEQCYVSVQQGRGVEGMGWDFEDKNQWLGVMYRGDHQPKGKEEEEGEEEKEQISPSQPLHLPASWIGPVSISRDMWQSRFPSGHKRTVYHQCVVDRWSPYLTGHKGLVMRIEEGGGERIEERFEHRRDRLQSRVIEGEHTTCIFEPGLMSGLREYRIVKGGSREFLFWKGSRVDGLVRRLEQVEKKVMEYYEDRDDRLIYRSLTVDQTGASSQQRGKAFTVSIGDHPDLPIRKLTEKYTPDRTVHPETDVIKRTHLLLENLIVLRYAECEGRLEGSEWVIDKNDKLETSEGMQGGGGSRGRLDRKTRGWKGLSRGEEQLLMSRLLIIEKELKVKVKERESRMTELVKSLDRMEQTVELVEGFYDAAYHAAINQQQPSRGMEHSDEGEISDSPTSDYLTPFLLSFPLPLNRKQAESVKQACLTALKERLLSRASIIQAHLEDEQTKLQSRQSAFKRQAGSGSMEANEEFQAFSEACLFRIDILLARRARHEQMAIKKFSEMEQQLNRDPRLSALHSAE